MENTGVLFKCIAVSFMFATGYAYPTDMNWEGSISEYQPNHYHLRKGIGVASNYLYQKMNNALLGARIPGNEHKRLFVKGTDAGKRLKLNGNLQEKRVMFGSNLQGK